MALTDSTVPTLTSVEATRAAVVTFCISCSAGKAQAGQATLLLMSRQDAGDRQQDPAGLPPPGCSLRCLLLPQQQATSFEDKLQAMQDAWLIDSYISRLPRCEVADRVQPGAGSTMPDSQLAHVFATNGHAELLQRQYSVQLQAG